MGGFGKYFHLALSMSFLLRATAAATSGTNYFHGGMSLSCTDAACSIDKNCTGLNSTPGIMVNNTSSTTVEYTSITGGLQLEPAYTTCGAECTGCVAVPGLDSVFNAHCAATPGDVFCPELNKCIKSFDGNCPFQLHVGKLYEGPVDLVCEFNRNSNVLDEGRCTDVTPGCQISVGSYSVGGMYLTDLIGTYTIPHGCNATCQGCSAAPAPPVAQPTLGPPAFPTPTPLASSSNHRLDFSMIPLASFGAYVMMLAFFNF